MTVCSVKINNSNMTHTIDQYIALNVKDFRYVINKKIGIHTNVAKVKLINTSNMVQSFVYTSNKSITFLILMSGNEAIRRT